MVNLKLNKLGIFAAGSALVLALASAPAKAHHDHSIVGPAVAFIALGALLHHSHHSHHRHHYRYKRHHHKHHRRHSHSHGGYHYPRRKHYDRY